MGRTLHREREQTGADGLMKSSQMRQGSQEMLLFRHHAPFGSRQNLCLIPRSETHTHTHTHTHRVNPPPPSTKNNPPSNLAGGAIRTQSHTSTTSGTLAFSLCRAQCNPELYRRTAIAGDIPPSYSLAFPGGWMDGPHPFPLLPPHWGRNLALAPAPVGQTRPS
ncbi:hypothetical protein VTK73DRAFT_1943 [Phialemonium thermophilum]|uniref:Uncharacterized protein n=1 Tax=Phialemonium thermophilum TaxID=223376 RepID=A0ABR3VSV1_9PEZI